jgi:predicted dehydrogenase
MGRRHVQVLGQLGVPFVGICDQSEAALEAAKSELQLPNRTLYTDPVRLLAEGRPECVIVSTTAPSHCALTCAAAAAGARYILCEKPMAVSLEQCDQMLSACAARGARLGINHQMRFMEQYTEPKRLMASPELGGVRSVTVVAGNFGLAMNACHYFEMFRYLADEPAIDATAWFSSERVPNPRGAHFEDRAGSIRLTTESGVRFYLEAGSDQGHGLHVTYAARNGRLTVDELTGSAHLQYRLEEHRELPTTRYAMPWEERRWRIAPADVLGPTQAVLEALFAESNYPSGEVGRAAVAGLVAAYLSHEQGHIPVATHGALPRSRVFPWA